LYAFLLSPCLLHILPSSSSMIRSSTYYLVYNKHRGWSQWPRGLGRGPWPLENLDLVFESRTRDTRPRRPVLIEAVPDLCTLSKLQLRASHYGQPLRIEIYYLF
jgi:hypothetical protein